MALNARVLTATTANLPSVLVGICLIFMTTVATADTRYVSDELGITLRTGKSTQHQILRMVTSGTPLTVLESDQE